VSQGRELDAMLLTESVDAGCAAGFEVLHRYVEEELAGGEAAQSHPGLAAHLVSCPACRQDYLGLVEAAQLFGDAGPTRS
jgi:hypothetical protein